VLQDLFLKIRDIIGSFRYRSDFLHALKGEDSPALIAGSLGYIPGFSPV
jgi:hypothetical protein